VSAGWQKMPRFKHWERRIEHLLLCVDTDKNWDVQNRQDDDVVTDERCSLEQGNGGTIEASKIQCEEAARAILRRMLDKLDPPVDARAQGRVVSQHGRRWLLLATCQEFADRVGYYAIECRSDGKARSPSRVQYVEVPR
jgi:hypothetical protein